MKLRDNTYISLQTSNTFSLGTHLLLQVFMGWGLLIFLVSRVISKLFEFL